MPTLRDFYLIEARLSYLEQILAALGLINPVDPAPSDISRLGAAQLEAFRRPGGPIVDPAVSGVEAVRPVAVESTVVDTEANGGVWLADPPKM